MPSSYSQQTDVLTLIGAEYDRLQTIIDKFDEQRFKVKGWTVAAAGALFAFGVNSDEVALVTAGAILVLFFGYLEMVYLDLQVTAHSRSSELKQLRELARRAGLGVEHDAYVYGLGRIFALHRFSFRRVPDGLRQRPHLTGLYGGLFFAMLLGAALLTWV